ncbi:MAG TPA: YafY family transcriptional regulator [Planctomycetes bacterium]|nr:YafY family transcriptional regulator [Planctomycetota bacterium]
MRRADRLFQIVQIFRRDRHVRARDLAGELEVSERTIYRDIQDLQASGIPIEGEAGVGYLLSESFDLPPLMFDQTECESLILGIRLASCFADEPLRRAAASAARKIEAVLPPKLLARFQETALFVPSFQFDKESSARGLSLIQGAIRDRCKVEIHYLDREEKASFRRLRPLALYFWGKVWTLAAWCELREDFRNFRLDRLQDLRVLEESFEDEEGKDLEAFLKTVS